MHWILSGDSFCESKPQECFPVCFCSDTTNWSAIEADTCSAFKSWPRKDVCPNNVSSTSTNLVEKLWWLTECIIMKLTGIAQRHRYPAQALWRLSPVLLFLRLPHPTQINTAWSQVAGHNLGTRTVSLYGTLSSWLTASFSLTAGWTSTHPTLSASHTAGR